MVARSTASSSGEPTERNATADACSSVPDAAPFRAAARFWGLTPVELLDDCAIAGSPERCLQRAVVRDVDGKRRLIESLSPAALSRKAAIAETLQRLADAGLNAVYPYLPTRRGDRQPFYAGRYWQMMPYLSGVALPRPDWAEHAWRGEALARFLLELRLVSQQAGLDPGTVFSLPDYADALLARIADHRSDLLPRLEPIRAQLVDRLWPRYDGLRVAFCHGDYHPLNVIWGGQEIRAVIDWEFCGQKPALYDLVNLMGCVGVEAPEALTGPLVTALLDALRAGGWGCDDDWDALPDLVLGLRFAWLSEWLRKDDAAMIDLELDYMALLRLRRDELAVRWGVAPFNR